MASPALSRAAQTGLLARRSPLMKLKGDEQLVALVRAGNSGAFDAIVDRYQARLLGFCRQMLNSTEDAEDVLQEVLVNAHKAILADNREINLKPWLYRIARNRSLNHLRRPKAEAKESMDMVPAVEESSTAAKVHNREEFRQLLSDVTKLPETQRAALMLREIEGLSYEEIAEAMETSIPSVKSLLVRARISLAEASQARALTCGEVKVELAEAAEGLVKASGPVRRHVKECDGCADFRKQLRSDSRTLAMLVPVGPIIALKMALFSKLGLGGGATAGSSLGAGAAGSAAGVTGAGAGAAAAGAGGAASGLGAIGSAVGMKAAAGLATAAVITAGAVEVRKAIVTDRATTPAGPSVVAEPKQAPPVLVTANEDGEEAVTLAAVIEPEAAPEVVPAIPVSTPPPAETVTTPPTESVSPPPPGLQGTVVDVPAEPPPPEVVNPTPEPEVPVDPETPSPPAPAPGQ